MALRPAAVSKHQALNGSLTKEKCRSKHWEREAKEGMEKIKRAEKEREEAKQEAKVARLAVTSAGDVKARVEDDLAKVLDALEDEEEDRPRSETEIARLAVERTSFLLELKASKDEVSSLHSQTGKEKEAMEEDYQKALDLIFSYGYGCCAFKHRICGDQLEIPNGMLDFANPLPPEFFVNLRCPQPQQPSRSKLQ